MSFRRVMSALGTRVAQSLEEANQRDPGIQYQRNAMADAQLQMLRKKEHQDWIRAGGMTGHVPPPPGGDPLWGQTVSH